MKGYASAVVNFLFEVGILAQTPRSGFSYLGNSHHQSVAEHIMRTAYVGYSLAHLEGADPAKVTQMCLFHDLGETRVSDLDYVRQRYVTAEEDRAIAETTQPLPFGGEIRELYGEYEKRKTLEAQVAKDADTIELLLSIKELSDSGNKKGESWIPSLLQRLYTESGKQLADEIIKTPSNKWWYKQTQEVWRIQREERGL